jgi:hypothetical protein
VYGTQEESIFFGTKVSNCGIAQVDVGGGSNQAQNIGPIEGLETGYPTIARVSQCPKPGTTFQGTPWPAAINAGK